MGKFIPKQLGFVFLKVFENLDICVARYFRGSNSKFSSSGTLLSSLGSSPGWLKVIIDGGPRLAEETIEFYFLTEELG